MNGALTSSMQEMWRIFTRNYALHLLHGIVEKQQQM